MSFCWCSDREGVSSVGAATGLHFLLCQSTDLIWKSGHCGTPPDLHALDCNSISLGKAAIAVRPLSKCKCPSWIVFWCVGCLSHLSFKEIATIAVRPLPWSTRTRPVEKATDTTGGCIGCLTLKLLNTTHPVSNGAKVLASYQAERLLKLSGEQCTTPDVAKLWMCMQHIFKSPQKFTWQANMAHGKNYSKQFSPENFSRPEKNHQKTYVPENPIF